MKSRFNKRIAFSVFLFFGFSVFFVLFQNFSGPEFCRAYYSNGSDVQLDFLTLGKVTKKSECLEAAVAEVKPTDCSAEKAKVHVMFGGEDLRLGARTSEIPYKNLVAEFQCGKVNYVANSSDAISLAQAESKSKFSEYSQTCKVTESEFTIDGFSQFCPGCFSRIHRRIADCGTESCHEVQVVEKIVQEDTNWSSLTVTRGGAPEFYCFKKRELTNAKGTDAKLKNQ